MSAAKRWAWLGLAALLVFDAWWRGHTFGPTLREATGPRAWPVMQGTTEPLDCDEAIYAYIGRRIVAGDVMYRDLTENKPPLGYWLFALAVKLGGATELTVRLMPVPFVLATIVLIWWIAARLGGPWAGFLAGLAYAIGSTDPYLYGNGMQLAVPINLLSTAALAAVVKATTGAPSASGSRSRWVVLMFGGCAIAAAGLVRQVAVLPGLIAVLAILTGPIPLRERFKGFAAFTLGGVAIVSAVVMALSAQGALDDAYEDVIRYGAALAAEAPPETNAPPLWMRWLTGNADPDGVLPPPFGTTTYLVWWGSGTWPLWLASVPALVWALRSEFGTGRRLIAGWTLLCWVEVALPRQFWAHYYLAPLPGTCLLVGTAAVDALRAVRTGSLGRRLGAGLFALGFLTAIAATVVIQVRAYLLVPADELTVRYKGGGQWVVLRELGRELKSRTAGWDDPRLYVWGIQSPLYIYSGLEGVTRQVFADNLIRAFADTDHRLIAPRIERALADLRAHPPALIFAGYPPFRGLRSFLEAHYRPVSIEVAGKPLPIYPNGMGLWVARERYEDFVTPRPVGVEAASTPR